ncbi:MAG: putative spermidine/putrescine transport system ATP-binding protein [Solirubrobacteraceae bacterium]|nr:putative spermidine/putrescine transport system ATP-binding protein [Solirubrobacteraceae bacterium]
MTARSAMSSLRRGAGATPAVAHAPLPAARSASVRVDGVRVTLGDNEVLRGVSLDVREGEFLTILGPSGSGKTTTLNTVAGFVTPSEGEVWFGDELITAVPVHRRDIGILFQSYALFPHLDVRRNVAYPLRERRISKAETRRRVSEALELVDLAGYEDRAVTTLSGGQQQRVGLARALVFGPRVLLLDEPLGALDKSLRERMQLELRRLQREVGVTTISVTHDQTEALSMSDRVAIMRDGLVEQIGRPEELYWQPETPFVATFLGEANLLPAVAGSRGAEVHELGIALPGTPGGQAVVRPEILRVVAAAEAGPGAGGRGIVRDAHFHGHRHRIVVVHPETGRELLVYRAPEDGVVEVGDEVVVRCHAPALVSVIPGAGDAPAARGAAVPPVDPPLTSTPTPEVRAQ